MSKTIILGGGLAGLITAYELSKILDPKEITIIGSQIGPSPALGLQYLHPSQEIETICADLQKKYSTVPVAGAILNKQDVVINYAEPNVSAQEALDIVKAHHLKTRGTEWLGKARTMNDFLTHAFTRSQPQKVKISPFDFGKALFDHLLVSGVTMAEGDLIKVLVNNMEIVYIPKSCASQPHWVKYDRLINTIPLRSFVELCEIAETPVVSAAACAYDHMLYKPIFVSDIFEDRIHENLKDFDFIYSPFNNWWYRMSKTTDNDGNISYQLEFANKIYSHAFGLHETKEITYGHIYTDKQVTLDTLFAMLHLKRIYCVGRFGKWQSETLVHQVAKEAQNIAGWIRDKIG